MDLLEVIRARIDEIRNTVHVPDGGIDSENAHSREDELFVFVLHAIADGADNAAELARLALTSREIDFPRWYS